MKEKQDAELIIYSSSPKSFKKSLYIFSRSPEIAKIREL